MNGILLVSISLESQPLRFTTIASLHYHYYVVTRGKVRRIGAIEAAMLCSMGGVGDHRSRHYRILSSIIGQQFLRFDP